MKTKVKKPNFRVKHPYGYLIKSMLLGLILVFTSIFSMATGIVDLNPKSTSEAEASLWSELVDSTYDATSSTHGFASGTGTYSDPFVIKTVAQWRCFADFVYNWNGGYGYYFSLGADLDFSGGYVDNYFSVGNTSSNRSAFSATIVESTGSIVTSAGTTARSFAGVFWGNGYRIKNVRAQEELFFRLFASIAGSSELQTGTSIEEAPNYNSDASSYATGVYDLVLYSVELDVEAMWTGSGTYSGLLVGRARKAVISNIYVYWPDEVWEYHNPEELYIGGIVGGIQGCQIYGCKVSNYKIVGGFCVGGIVGGIDPGYGPSYIVNCHNNADIYGNNDYSENVGGIVGYVDVTATDFVVIRNCWNTGKISYWSTLGSSSTDGDLSLFELGSFAGIAGSTNYLGSNSSYLRIQNCYNAGEVSVQSYQSGSLTTTYGWAIANSYYWDDNFQNFYLGTKNSSSADGDWEYPYSSDTAFKVISNTTSGIGKQDANSAYYVSGYGTGDTSYAYPVHSVFPVYGNNNGYTVKKETNDVNPEKDTTDYYIQVGSTVAKKVYLTLEGPVNDIFEVKSYSNISLHSSTDTEYNFTRVPGASSSIVLQFNQAISTTIIAYSSFGEVSSTTSSTGIVNDTTTTTTISLDKDSICEYHIIVSVSGTSLPGFGTYASPYLISSPDHLYAVDSLMNTKLFDEVNAYFRLTSDITITSSTYITKFNTLISGEFHGYFNGGGHTIDMSALDDNPLFSSIGENGVIYKLNIIAKVDYSDLTKSSLLAKSSKASSTYDNAIGFVLAKENKGLVDSVNLYINGDAKIKLLGWEFQQSTECGLLVGLNYSGATIKNCYVGPYDAGLDYINSQGTMDKGVSFANICISHEALSCTNLYVGGICGQNHGSLIGNSTSLSFYDMDSIIDNVIDNGYSVYVGGIVGYDGRYDADNLLADNYAEGQNLWGPSNFPNDSYSAGGIAGYIGGSGASTSNTVRNVSFYYMAGYPYVDHIAGYTNITGLDAHNFASSSSNHNNGSGGNTHTSLYSQSITYSMYGDESENFDPQYWIALSGNEGMTGYLDGFYIGGQIYYPRSKKPYGSTVQSNNWSKNNSTTLSIDDTTTAVNISSALEFGALAQYINANGQGSLTTINFTADIYMYGKYWTPISSLSDVTINGNNHTIYGLDAEYTQVGDEAMASMFAGLISVTSGSLTVKNLNFEDCTIVTGPLSMGYVGFVVGVAMGQDDSTLNFDNIHFTNCHICADIGEDRGQFINCDANIGELAGFVIGTIASRYSNGGIYLNNITIDAEYVDNNFFNSSITANKALVEIMNVYGSCIGADMAAYGIVIDGLVINGLDMINHNGFSYMSGVVGYCSSYEFIVLNSYIVALNMKSESMVTVLAGIGINVNSRGFFVIANSVIDINFEVDLNNQDAEGKTLLALTLGNTGIGYCDINLTMNYTNPGSSMTNFYNNLECAAVMGSDVQVLDNIIRIESNFFPTETDGNGLYLFSQETVTCNNNLFYITANNYNYIYGTPKDSVESASFSDNVFYFANGSAGTIRLYSESGAWTTATTLTTAQMAGLANGGGSLVGNGFFANKFIKSNWGNTLVGRFNEADGLMVVPFKGYDYAHFYVPLYIGGVGFEVYNVLDNYAQISAHNSFATSDETVTILRNGQYTLPYTTDGTSGTIYLVEGDTLTFVLNDSSYKYTAAIYGYSSQYGMDENIDPFTNDNTSNYTYTVPSSLTSTEYWTSLPVSGDSPDYWLAVYVTISQAGRYFAVEGSMEVDGATAVGVRDNYFVYRANEGASVTVKKKGNTTGYATNATWTETAFLTDDMKNLDGTSIWTDGTNMYYSSGSAQYELNKGTNTWSTKTWTGLTSFYGDYIWTDGTNIYYSFWSTQYELNGDTWKEKTWTGLTSFYGNDIWTDGTNYYYSYSSTQYKLNKSTSEWSTMTWTGFTSFNGLYIWTDGTNYYYSNGSTQYKLNKDTSTWETMTWSGLTSFYGSDIWTDGTNYYYSYSSSQYELNKSTMTWSTKTWSGRSYIDGYCIWTDGTNYYYSDTQVAAQYVLNGSTWETVTWSSKIAINGQYIWTDGTNIYYTNGSHNQYELNKSTMTWTRKTWSGVYPGSGDSVWTDGTNYYYSYSSSQYELNKSTMTWSTKKWTGLTSFYGHYIWTDGTNYYYSYSSNQYILNKDTSTWTAKIWSGSYYPSYGDYIWTDGTNYYYSNGSTQYKLNKDTSTWETMTWSGLTWFYGDDIWTDGTNTYYSSEYVLNKDTSTWSTKTWTGLTSFDGDNIWTDGTNYYYSNAGEQYILDNAYISGISKGSLSSSNVYSGSVISSTNNGTSTNGYRSYTFTVDASTSSSAMTGSIVAYNFGSETMKLHTINNNAGASSNDVYLTTSVSGTTKFTSVYLKSGETVTYHYPTTYTSSDGDYEFSSVEKDGVCEDWTTSGYTSDTDDVTTTVTYVETLYQDQVIIEQEGTNDIATTDSYTVNSDISDVWGGLNGDFAFNDYGNETQTLWSSIPGYTTIRRNAYVTMGDYVLLGTFGSNDADIHISYTKSMAYGTSVTATVHYPAGYKVSSITYGGSSVAFTVDSSNNTATFTYTTSRGGDLIISVVQDKWDDADNRETPTGSGTSSSPYIIDTAGKFGWMINKINSTSGNSSYYQISADIDLAGKFVSPITSSFNGTIDGTSSLYSIKNMKIIGDSFDTSNDHTGFISSLSGTLKNVIFVDPIISTKYVNDTSTAYFIKSLSGTVSNVGIRCDTDGTGFVSNNVIFFGSFNAQANITSFYNASKVYVHKGSVVEYNSANGNLSALSSVVSINKFASTSAPTGYYMFKNMSGATVKDVVVRTTPSNCTSKYAIYKDSSVTASGSISNLYYLSTSGISTGTTTGVSTSNVASKTADALKSTSNYNGWDMTKWIFAPTTGISNNRYRGQVYDATNKYPLLTMGSASNLTEVTFYYKMPDGSEGIWNSAGSYGWSMDSYALWIQSNSSFGVKLNLSGSYNVPLYLASISAKSGFTTNFTTITNVSRYATGTYTVSGYSFDGSGKASILITFTTAKSTFTTDFNTGINTGVHTSVVTTPSTATSGSSTAKQYDYWVSSNYNALVFQTFTLTKVGSVTGSAVVLSGHSTVTTERYIYLNGSTYTLSTSASGTGTLVGIIKIAPSSEKGGKITLTNLKEDVVISATMYVAVTISYSGLSASAHNTITNYYNSAEITNSTTSTSFGTLRSNTSTASSSSATYYAPVINPDNSSSYHIGSVLAGNTSSYTWGTLTYNGITYATNSSYSDTNAKAISVLATTLANTSSETATLVYTYGPGEVTYTVKLNMLVMDTPDSPMGVIYGGTTYEFSSNANGQTVAIKVGVGVTPTFSADLSATNGIYRAVWGDDPKSSNASAVSGQEFSCATAIANTNKTYTLNIIQQFIAVIKTDFTNIYNGSTYVSTYKDAQKPSLSISYSSPYKGGASTVNPDPTYDSTCNTNPIVDYGSTITYTTADNTEVATGVRFSDIYSCTSSPSTTITLTKGNVTTEDWSNMTAVSHTFSYNIIVREIVTTITNQNLEKHPNDYIGVTLSNSTSATKNNNSYLVGSAYVIKYDGMYKADMTTALADNDKSVRGYRRFYVVGGENVTVKRGDVVDSTYQNSIQSINGTNHKGDYEFTDVKENGIVVGVKGVVKCNDVFNFTYYPYVQMQAGFKAINAVSWDAKNNIYDLLDGDLEIYGKTAIKSNGVYVGSGDYYSTSNNIFETPTYFKIVITIPTANLTGWKNDKDPVWCFNNTDNQIKNGGEVRVGNSSSGDVIGTYVVHDKVVSGSNTIFTLEFPCVLEDSNIIQSITYYLAFEEQTYKITSNSKLKSGGGDPVVNDTVAYKSLSEYKTLSCNASDEILKITKTKDAIGFTAGYFGYYKVFYETVDANNFKYYQGDNGALISKQTSTYEAHGDFKKWHTISDPTISIDYYTSGYTDNEYVLVEGTNYKYTFYARTTNSDTALDEIGSITLSGITKFGNDMKVLEDDTLTVSYTTNINKFRCTSAPANNKKITADTTITGAFAENIINLYFYRNTASDEKLNSDDPIKLGTLNWGYTIPGTYQGKPTNPDEYTFEIWSWKTNAGSGNMTLLNSSDLSNCSIKERSLNGANNTEFGIYANWRREYYHTFTNNGVTTTHKTIGESAAGGKFEGFTISTDPKAVGGKYKYENTVDLSYTINTGYKFTGYTVSNGNLSKDKTTLSTAYSSCKISNSEITYDGTTFFVQDSYLYTDGAHVIRYSAFDYKVESGYVYIYDKPAVTVTANFEELTYDITITQPTGGKITIDSHASLVPDIQYNTDSLPTRITLGYFSCVYLRYTNTNSSYRFKQWNFTNNAFTNSVNNSSTTATFGPNVTNTSTISVSEYSQKSIELDSFVVRYLTSDASSKETSTPSVSSDSGKVTFTYAKYKVEFSSSNSAYPIVYSGSGTTVYVVTGVEYDITTSLVITDTDNMQMYEFITPDTATIGYNKINESLTAIGSTGYSIGGSVNGTVTAKFSSSVLTADLSKITWKTIPKQEIIVEDHTSSNNDKVKVYVATQGNSSVKVVEGTKATIKAEDYVNSNATKSYKFSHWTFSGADWMTDAESKTAELTFDVYANRAGTYTAHYTYAYSLNKDSGKIVGGECTTKDITSAKNWTVTGSNYYDADGKYLSGSTITITAEPTDNYVFYGWYAYDGTNYSKIGTDPTLTFTVGGTDCEGTTIDGIDLEKFTIVYICEHLLQYKFGGSSSNAPEATYKVSGAGIIGVGEGAKLNDNTATMTASGTTMMTVYVKEGTEITFEMSKTTDTAYANGVSYGDITYNTITTPKITFTGNGFTGLSFSLTAGSDNTGDYKVIYQQVFTVINVSDVGIADTHVTESYKNTKDVTNSIVNISANTAGVVYNNKTYYNKDDIITLKIPTMPDGHQFVKWVINGSDYTRETATYTLESESITSITLYIKEIEYTVTKAVTNLKVPKGFNTSITSDTIWTSNSFGEFTYSTDHTSSETKVGYFGKVTIGSFTSGNKLYINGGKAYYDSEYKHSVCSDNYTISESTLTYLGNSYTISNNVATIWYLYINPTYTVSTGTLEDNVVSSIKSNITITCTVEMQGKLRSKGLNRKDSAVIVTTSENTEKVVNTVTYTAETKTGYVFKGWAIYDNNGNKISGEYFSTATSITVTLTEENNGYTYVAEYNPTFSLKVSADTFRQGSVQATIGGEIKTAITKDTTYSDIEWGTSITLTATANSGIRTYKWTGNDGEKDIESENADITFTIQGNAEFTHKFLNRYTIDITHTDENGGTWTIEEYDDIKNLWKDVDTEGFVGVSGSKTFTLADEGTQYRIVVTTKPHYYVSLSAEGDTTDDTISGENNIYSSKNDLKSYITFSAKSVNSTVTISHTGLNYVYIDTSPSGLGNTVTIDADYLNTEKTGTGTLGKESSPIVLKNDGSTNITTTAVIGYDYPTWNDGTEKSLTYTLENITVGTTYHVTIKYPDNSRKTINLTVVGYTGEFKYASIVSDSAQNTQPLKHAYEVNGLSLKEGLTALRFSDFDTNIVSSVKVSDGENEYTGTSSVDYTIPTGTDTISLTLTATNNTWIDKGNYTDTKPSGSGTADNPYKIANASDFAWISYQSATGENFAGKYFIQTGDIDLSGHLWVPIQNFNGVFVGSHSYSIKNITTSDEKYNFADTSISNNLYYSMSLFANSNGGVFKTLKITDYDNTSWVTKVSQLESHAVLLAKGTDVVIDGIILDNVILKSNTFNDNSGLLVASLTGGKISNVEFDELSSYIYDHHYSDGNYIKITDEITNKSLYNAGLVGETKASTKTYVDSNGNSVNVVIENIKMYDGIISSVIPVNSVMTPSFIVGINTSTLSLNNIYVNNTNTTSSNAIYYSALFDTNSGTITAQNIVINSKSSSMSTYDTMIGTNTGTLTCTDVYGTYKFSTSSDTYSGYTKTSTFTSAFNTLYNKGGNVWYKGGMDIFGEYTTSSSDDAVTITSGVIQLSGNITMAKFKNALSALSTNSSVTKVELLSDIDFGGATLDTSYSIPAGKTFDGHGYTISGIKAVRRVISTTTQVSGIFDTISGTLKRVVFNNIYVYVLPTSIISVDQPVAIIGANNSGLTVERVTVQNSRLNVVYDGLVGTPTIGVLGKSIGSGSITYVDIVNTKITVSNYDTSSTGAFKIGGLVGYVTVPVSNVQIGTDIVVDSNSTGHLVSGVAGYSSATMSNIAVKGNITATNSNVYTISGAGSTTISTAFVSGTFSPKATVLNANCTATNVYISANASSASGTKSDAQMKTQSTYSGFNFDGTSSGDTLTWYIDADYPTFTIPSNHMKVSVTLSGDGAISGVGNSITLIKSDYSSADDNHGSVALTSAGSTSRLYATASGNYSYKLIVVTAKGYVLDISESTFTNEETDLSKNWSGTTDSQGKTTYTIDTAYNRYDLTYNFVIKKVEYSVDINVVGHGTVTGAGSYKTGDSVTLTATPNTSTNSHTEHYFIGWYKGSTQVSTSTTYSFVASEETTGTYQAKFCSDASGNCKFKATASMSSGSQSTVSPSDTGWVVGGGTGSAYEKTFTVTLADGEEITSITRDGTQIYSKVGGVTNTSLYTATISSSMFTLKVLINSTTKGAYIFTTGATSQVVTINIPNVGGSTRSENDAYSAHGIINLSTSSTSSTIVANATTGTISVIYGQTLTIEFMSNIRYKLGSIETTVSGGNTNFTTSTSTVDGYTRYTYSYTTSAITSDTEITLNLVKDRWVDFTSSTSYTAGHSTEFITANGGTASNEISSSSATFGSDKAYKGTETNPFIISTPAQLARVSYLVNINASFMTYKGSTLTQVYYKDACYKITADIDLNNYFWTPINVPYYSSHMTMVSEQQSVISNMYLRYDKEESNISSDNNLTKLGFFAYANNNNITGITFDNAVVYNSSTTGTSAVVSATTLNSALNFVTVKNSTVEVATDSAVVLYASGNEAITLNSVNSLSNTIKVVSDTTGTIHSSGVIYGSAGDMVLNNISVSGLSVQNNTSRTVYVSGITYNSSMTIINNAVVDNINTTGSNIYVKNIAYFDAYGNEYQNVWTKSSTNNFSSQYGIGSIGVLSSTPSLEDLGLSSSIWYITNNKVLTKGYGAGENNISQVADVTTGGFAGGTGIQSDPYLISNATQFRYLQYLVNSGNATYNSTSKYYKITADIDLGDGISTYMGKDASKKFVAHLDGDFHTISNMFIFDAYNTDYVGFVAYSGTGSTIKNLNLNNYTVIAKANVGGVVGNATYGVYIDNVNLTNAFVSGRSDNVGGIVAITSNNWQDVVVENTAFSGIVASAYMYQGGIVGKVEYGNTNYDIYIKNSHTDGVMASHYSHNAVAGGILGYVLNSTYSRKTYISDCYNNMKLLSGAGVIGGIAGYTYNTEISKCYNNCEIVLASARFVGSSNTYYNSDSDYNNGSVSIATNSVAFYGEIVGRNYNNTSNTTVIVDSNYSELKKIVASNSSATGILIPYGNSMKSGHTPNGYSIYTSTSSIEPTYTSNIGSADMLNASAMTEVGNFSNWDSDTIWYFDGTNTPVHRWNTQNRLYFEGLNLDISVDGFAVIVDGGKITFADGVKPAKDSDNRIFVYVSGSTLLTTFVPDANNILETAQVRDYYDTVYSLISGSSISFDEYSDGTSFKVLKSSFINDKFTITINTSLTRGNGIAVGEYETLHIVVLNTTTNVGYTCTLENGTYVFDELTAGTYYVAVYTSMFFDVSNISCPTEGITLGEVQFYRTLVLSNSTSANATINITANKTVDAWIYSKVEVGA